MILVASYNIRKAVGLDRRRRPERIIEVLCEMNADVIALQEADRRFGSREAALPFHLIAEHSPYQPVPFNVRAQSLGWHGNAILVRKDAHIRQHRPLILPALEPRGAVLADIEINDQPLRVIGAHLDLSGLWRRRQAAAIMGHVSAQDEQLPTVIMGDLNEWRPTGGCLQDFAQHYAFAPTPPTFHARQPVGRLDRIIVSPGIDVVETGVHRSLNANTASDHLPVWARLVPGQSTTAASALSWASVQDAGALSGRQRRNFVPWRKRSPVT